VKIKLDTTEEITVSDQKTKLEYPFNYPEALAAFRAHRLNLERAVMELGNGVRKEHIERLIAAGYDPKSAKSVALQESGDLIKTEWSTYVPFIHG
jgi:hypothetical protein